MMMGRPLGSLPQRQFGQLPTRLVTPAKEVDPYYHSPEHVKWREQVIQRARWRCQWVEDGKRCWRGAPAFRLYADHIKERADGGSDTDLSNGWALCPHHHTIKTNMERAKRMARKS